ncbi:MAG: hypothetical protein OHK0015_49950 [Chloroflexi bacterium OHK40]
MRVSETYHRYPRLMTTAIAWLSALLVAVAMLNLGATFLRGLWDLLGRDDALLGRLPWLRPVVAFIDAAPRARADSIGEFLPTLIGPLAWAAVALLVALVLRNAFPAIRTSDRGILVEFAGSWLPVPWENIYALKVTEDLAGERFVVIAETDRRQLTLWHRLYSLAYDLRGRRGFYITSSINQFDTLVRTILSESQRTARALEGARAVQLREDAQSPLFRLLLSPGSFFSRSAVDDAATTAAAAPLPIGGPVRATYPARITSLLAGTAAVLSVAMVLNYLSYWARFLALSIPRLRTVPPFNWTLNDSGYVELYNAFRTRAVPLLGAEGRPDLPAPLWLLVAAHLMLLLAVPGLLWLRNVLPSLESRDDGLAVRNMLNGRWQLIPWQRVRAFKATEVSEQSQILLLQAPGLPGWSRLSSLIYDGGLTPGVLITSAIGHFQPLLSHALNRLAPLEKEGAPPILQQEARSWLLWLALRRRPALEALVGEARDDPASRAISGSRLLVAARPMALLALLPALLLLAAGLLGDRLPSPGLIGGALALWLFGMLEWPLAALVSLVLDDTTGGGEEGYRALYLYPVSQLPRVIPLLVALLLQIVGVPVLPTLAWVAAIAWAYWQASGLFETLYEWRGSQAVLGGLLPVVWQLLLLIGFLVATR